MKPGDVVVLKNNGGYMGPKEGDIGLISSINSSKSCFLELGGEAAKFLSGGLYFFFPGEFEKIGRL